MSGKAKFSGWGMYAPYSMLPWGSTSEQPWFCSMAVVYISSYQSLWHSPMRYLSTRIGILSADDGTACLSPTNLNIYIFFYYDINRECFWCTVHVMCRLLCKEKQHNGWTLSLNLCSGQKLKDNCSNWKKKMKHGVGPTHRASSTFLARLSTRCWSMLFCEVRD